MPAPGPESYPKVRPAGHHPLPARPDRDDLATSAGAGHDPDRARRHVEFAGDQSQQRFVRGALDGSRGYAGAQLAIAHAVDPVGAAAWRQPDGEADLGRVPAQAAITRGTPA